MLYIIQSIHRPFSLPLSADSAITLENLRRFVREHSSVYMVLVGCLEQYDYLAKRFTATVAATSAQSMEALAVINEAEEQQTQLSEKVVLCISIAAWLPK